ncbi:MAG: DUF2079 domain-containing protein [Pirellulaceae bacterium]
MADRSPNPSSRQEVLPANGLLASGLIIVCLWFALTTSVSSRVHLVVGYTTIPSGPPQLEMFLATSAGWLFAGFMAALWLWLLYYAARRNSPAARRATMWLGLAIAPLCLSVTRVFGSGQWPQPSIAEPLWLAFWTGLSFSILVEVRVAANSRNASEPKPHTSGQTLVYSILVVSLAAICSLWWYSQSVTYHRNFMLGYNDFGHFIQRIANTAAGRGLLLESPVLPRFWDHFNPGLILLVPLWQLLPGVETFFALHAATLAFSGVIIYAIARKLAQSPMAASLWCGAWLAQPVIGQMNLAYTYGWHPIAMAIPALLGALLMALRGRYWVAILLAVLAMAMEEGPIVVVSLFLATCGWWAFVDQRRQRLGAIADSSASPLGQFINRLSWPGWSTLAAATTLLFLVVYRFSGLAEFQTARFVALGDTPWQIILSPVIRPAAFWGELLRWDKFAFVGCLWLPCFVFSLARGRRWLLPTLLPLGVLLVWDHRPASSLAFQYTSGLLPIFWLATIVGGADEPSNNNRHRCVSSASGALFTGLVLSLFVGQLPYSSPTLIDVEGTTYSVTSPLQRLAHAEDGIWLAEQVQRLQQDGGEVLATGRIAAHLVGNRDLETVGQYLERRAKLAQLPDRRDNPLGHYQWIILDRRETFQQSPEGIQEVESEALERGFKVVADQYEIVIMKRDAS